MAQAAAELRLVGEASVPGELYDLGHFPGAVLGHDAGRRIAGLLFELPEEDGMLHMLDAYEEFEPERPELSQFMRVRCEARLATGEALPCCCWIYVYARNLKGVRQIEDGIWHGPVA